MLGHSGSSLSVRSNCRTVLPGLSRTSAVAQLLSGGHRSRVVGHTCRHAREEVERTRTKGAESLLIEARTRHGRPPLTSHQSSGCLAETRPDGSACSHPLECVWANSGWHKGVPRMTTPCRRTNGDLSPLPTTAAQVVHCAASKNTRQLARSIRFGICVWFMCMGPQLFLQDWRCGQRREEHARHKYRQRAGRGVHWPPGAERLLREIDAGRGRTRLASVRRPAPLTHLGGCRGCSHHRHGLFHERHLQCAWKETSDLRRNGSTDSPPSSLLCPTHNFLDRSLRCHQTQNSSMMKKTQIR